MNVHQRIRQGRERLGMTEEQFGAAVGVSRGAVQQWEREDEAGGTAPTRRRQAAVAALLGISVAELMSDGTAAGDGWPFPGIDREHFEALLPDQKIEIQGMVRAALSQFSATNAQRAIVPKAKRSRA